MTEKKEQARKLREAAGLLDTHDWPGLIDDMKEVADRLDPPPPERRERVRSAYRLALRTASLKAYGGPLQREWAEPYPSEVWDAVLAEADKGRISEAKLRAWVCRRVSLGNGITVPAQALLAAIDSGELGGD